MQTTTLQLLLVTLLGCLLLVGSGGGGGSGTVSNCPADIVELDDGELGLSTAMNISLNPHGTTPLSALLSFSAPVEGTVSLTVMGKPPDGIDISHAFSAPATEFELPVLGLYPDYANHVVVAFEAACNGQTTSDTLTVMTMPLPAPGNDQVTLPVSVEIVTNQLPADDQSLYLFSQQKSAFDQTGAVRWTYLGEGWQFYRQLENGNWLGNINTDQVVYHFGDFAEFSMLGETVAEYRVVNYLHHEVQKLPWGNYLVASNSSPIQFNSGVPEEDVLYEYDADTKQVVKTWDFNLILDPARPPIPSNSRPDDWLHLNAAYYDATDETIVITAQRQSVLVKIRYDYDFGDPNQDDLLWILGAHEDWPVALASKLLRPVDAQGNTIDTTVEDFWPYGPHAGLSIADDANGNARVLAYDNGNFRGWYADNGVAGTSYSRGVEYTIDEDAMTVQLTWQYSHVPPMGTDPIATDFTGDIDLLPDGNILLGFAWSNQPNASDAPRVVEIERDGSVVFEAVSNRGESEYRVENIDLYAGQ